MEREQALNRVVELAMKWQQKHEWAATFKAADRFREYRDKGTERFDNLADERHGQVIAAHSEFIEMENLLRQHAPQFLELVPGVNFFTDSATDHSQQIRDVKKLEGAVRSMLTPQKQTAKQTIEQTIHPAETDDNAIKLQAGKKPWTDLATDLKGKWFSAMRRKKVWIPRKQFLIDFFNGTEGNRDKWKGNNAETEDKRFSDNPDQWKSESVKLKASFKQATKNRR